VRLPSGSQDSHPGCPDSLRWNLLGAEKRACRRDLLAGNALNEDLGAHFGAAMHYETVLDVCPIYWSSRSGFDRAMAACI
jgi:hypothetical protein